MPAAWAAFLSTTPAPVPQPGLLLAPSPPPWPSAALSPHELLLRRAFDTAVVGVDAGSCPANYYSCASHGSQFSAICCPFSQVCSLDADKQPACCPAG